MKNAERNEILPHGDGKSTDTDAIRALLDSVRKRRYRDLRRRDGRMIRCGGFPAGKQAALSREKK